MLGRNCCDHGDPIPSLTVGVKWTTFWMGASSPIYLDIVWNPVPKELEEEQKEKMSPDPLPIPVDQSDGIDRMESIPFGNTPFPNMPPPGGIREKNEDSDSSDDDQMEDSTDSTKNAALEGLDSSR